MPTLETFQWASRVVSLFNTIAMLWLGLMVLLNADRRRAGTWLAGGGLVVGGLFFAAHSVFVGRQFGTFAPEMDFWWRAAWLPFLVPPYLWYLVMAWYAGKLRSGRHRLGLLLLGGWGLAAMALLLLLDPLPAFRDLVEPTGAVPGMAGILGLIAAYPGFSLLCIALAVVVLRRPETSERFMGDLGRRRAVPWLIAASGVLLAIAVVVGGIAAGFLFGVQAGRIVVLTRPTISTLMGFDLLISSLVAAATVLMGRAIVSYEIFTGRTLPRSGLFRWWRSSLILAAGYGLLVGGSLELPVDPIYRLLLATLLMTLFFALLSWRAYVERERSMDRLRPFVAGPRLYERLLLPTGPLELDVGPLFRALCDDVLGARVGYLVALGPMASLVGPPLAYPTDSTPPDLGDLVGRFHAPNTICTPLDPARSGGAVWAVPLWSERGLIGVLLLGEKRDGGLYTQEEIEIARASGERLIDARASAEMAARLMALQRQRLAESQVVDGRTRRLLHDDVLPRLHTAMLALSVGGDSSEAVGLLSDTHREIASLLRAMPAGTPADLTRLGLIDALRRELDDELGANFDAVAWEVEPEARRLAGTLPPLATEVLFGAAREVIRNAARHARAPSRPLHLTVSAASQTGLRLVVEDDGIGLGAIRKDGSGQGLALHSAMMAVIGGALTVESTPGTSTRITLTLPEGGFLGTT